MPKDTVTRNCNVYITNLILSKISRKSRVPLWNNPSPKHLSYNSKPKHMLNTTKPNSPKH